MGKICVYCGSSLGKAEVYIDLVLELARQMKKRDMGLIYGGGNIGIMGVMAQELLDLGGEVTEVIPEFFLQDYQVKNLQNSEVICVKTMQERKRRMLEISDAFLCLPGAFGTMDEWFETLAMRQLRKIHQPMVLLNYRGFYDFLLRQIQWMNSEKFLSDINLSLFKEAKGVEEALEYISQEWTIHAPKDTEK